VFDVLELTSNEDITGLNLTLMDRLSKAVTMKVERNYAENRKETFLLVADKTSDKGYG
jgi:hypothetical protein